MAGKKKSAQDDGKNAGVTATNISNLTGVMNEVKASVKDLGTKIDCSNEKREKEYRKMLVVNTKLSESCKSLHHYF
jgi:hypothetical protein